MALETPVAPGADPAASDLIDFLRSSGAGSTRHAAGRTLLDHLVETYAIVRRWRQPDWLARAALLHRVYDADGFTRQLSPLSRRGEVAQLAGPRAQRTDFPLAVYFESCYPEIRDEVLSINPAIFHRESERTGGPETGTRRSSTSAVAAGVRCAMRVRRPRSRARDGDRRSRALGDRLALEQSLCGGHRIPALLQRLAHRSEILRAGDRLSGMRFTSSAR